MVWDDHFGTQPNPYDAEEFRRILAALEAVDDGSKESQELIALTREALEREEKG